MAPPDALTPEGIDMTFATVRLHFLQSILDVDAPSTERTGCIPPDSSAAPRHSRSEALLARWYRARRQHVVVHRRARDARLPLPARRHGTQARCARALRSEQARRLHLFAGARPALRRAGHHCDERPSGQHQHGAVQDTAGLCTVAHGPYFIFSLIDALTPPQRILLYTPEQGALTLLYCGVAPETKDANGKVHLKMSAEGKER